MGTVKRFESYETIGGLFAELTGETLELTVIQRIWGLIMEVINIIAEFISCDPFELTENVINNNHQIKAVKMAFDRLDLAERRLKSLAKLEIMILNGRIMIR